MTPLAWILLASAAAVAAVDWAAAARADARAERRVRPLVSVALIATACAVDPADRAQRAAFVVALVLSLARDLLGPRGRRGYTAAVAASLAAHLAYVVGFQQVGWSWLWAAAGIVVVLVATLGYAVRLVLSVRAKEPALTPTVVAYTGVLSLMVVAASATGRPTAVAGAFLFSCSDALGGWNRFREETPHARLAITVSYHLARILLVLSLV
ncbi:lysoplasmalogenase [Yinghuangia sp. ASG 101]|uniref:lysoplasmalogenase family protein n=1 Tax=Yinghuangia sp. ASG 101 TaxID=2896848 RepID=UPI001E2B3AEC|nr:lysoplasmalogenase family protein [Yinghuangia sp. ASG 101]UGQ09821.1 lysoplasmalogenase [Yinghuangia sp. ASG 101]